jgi:hypothetical protein
MTLRKSVKLATEATVSELQKVDRFAGPINFQASLFSGISQAVYRTRTLHAGWIVVRRRRGWSRSIPVYVRRSEPLWGAVSGGAS